MPLAYWNNSALLLVNPVQTDPIIMKIKIANMCNCGNKRNELNHSPTSMSGPVVTTTRHQPTWPDVSFEYTGKTALSVAGNITGKKYRFHHPGDIQLIDYRDASGMMAIPVLKKTKEKE